MYDKIKKYSENTTLTVSERDRC